MYKQQFIENFVCQYMATWAATHSDKASIDRAIWEANEAWKDFQKKLHWATDVTVRHPKTDKPVIIRVTDF